MKSTRKIIRIDEEKCDGCGLCVPSCAEGAIRLVDGKARLIAQKYCDGLGACLGECPRGALAVIDAQADPFDEEAARELVRSGRNNIHAGLQGTRPTSLSPMTNDHPVVPAVPAAAAADHLRPSGNAPEGKTLPCGCPSTLMQTFAPQAGCAGGNIPVSQGASGVSALTHWPVQIRLVPPSAPFLQGADLLVAADCTPVAYPRFHDGLLRGKRVLLGCPKFDDAEEYIKKFAAIFATAAIKSVTIVVMEVPCCQGLPVIVRKGMALAGKEIPIEVVVISARGEKI